MYRREVMVSQNQNMPTNYCVITLFPTIFPKITNRKYQSETER